MACGQAGGGRGALAPAFVIDGVFGTATTGGVIVSAATGLEANAIAHVQAWVRRGAVAPVRAPGPTAAR